MHFLFSGQSQHVSTACCESARSGASIGRKREVEEKFVVCKTACYTLDHPRLQKQFFGLYIAKILIDYAF
jgi:hypothetical protein